MVQQMSCIHYANGNGITTGYYITADWGITKSCHITTTYYVIHSLEITTRVLSIATASQMALCHSQLERRQWLNCRIANSCYFNIYYPADGLTHPLTQRGGKPS